VARLTRYTAVYTHGDAASGPVLLQTVSVDELTPGSAQTGRVGGHERVAAGQATSAQFQPLTVAAAAHPQVTVSAAAQRVDVR